MTSDYSGQNLRGRSFQGQNLEGANFSGADIRGTNFTDAILRQANFSQVTAGLKHTSVVVLFIAAMTLWSIFGFTSTYVGYAVHDFTHGQGDYISGGASLGVLLVFFSIAALHSVEAAFVSAVFLSGIATAIVDAIPNNRPSTGVSFAGAIVAPIASAVIIASIVTVINHKVVTIASTVVVACTVAVTASVITAKAKTNINASVSADAVTGVIICGFILLSGYVAWRALTGDKKYTRIRGLAIAVAAIGGTSFRGADLTDANFTLTTLKNTDFRNTILTRTCFHDAKELGYARPGKTYLQNSRVCKLLVTQQGQDKNFDRQNLRGVNLLGASLADASFIGSDLSEANLQNTDLSRAKLIQAQLDGTDLTGAKLTGATIEDWNITSHTKLYGVRCDYVFMRLPTPDDPNPRRKPDNWNETFAEGDFADFIKPIVDTLDLYHNSGVDPRAIAISFKQLAENHPEAELDIVALEQRGEGNLLLKATTTPDADRSALSAEYFEYYNKLKALPKEALNLLVVLSMPKQFKASKLAVTSIIQTTQNAQVNPCQSQKTRKKFPIMTYATPSLVVGSLMPRTLMPSA